MEETVDDKTLKRIIVTLIAIAGFILWNISERADCGTQCSTDISARSK